MIDRIYIPTLGRPNEQVTWDNLPTELKKKVWFVIHEKEEDLYDYDAKYVQGLSEHIIPAKLPKSIYNQCLNYAKIVHNILISVHS